MLRDRIIRAWKDPDYRMSLSEEERAEVPENPAGAIELTDDELDLATGGHYPSWYRPSQSQRMRPYSSSSRPSSYSSSQSSNSARLQPYSSNQSQSSSMSSQSSSMSSNSYSQRQSGSWNRSYSWRR